MAMKSFMFESTAPDGSKSFVLINLEKIISIETRADTASAIVDGGFVYRMGREDGVAIQTFLIKGASQ
jgi:hypothetical protein